MCGKSVDSYLQPLKFVPDWSVRQPLISTLFSVIAI